MYQIILQEQDRKSYCWITGSNTNKKPQEKQLVIISMHMEKTWEAEWYSQKYKNTWIICQTHLQASRENTGAMISTKLQNGKIQIILVHFLLKCLG